ncbi:cell wall hydrolase [Sphingomonas mesophila]|uniref:cell wall hydrolase n=1 Tax=Sphingomonas mesophila TaxID=2303576 RepID=UPI000E582B74|nr:cell wall hydrolase [Sphingomonas mesophila]
MTRFKPKAIRNAAIGAALMVTAVVSWIVVGGRPEEASAKPIAAAQAAALVAATSGEKANEVRALGKDAQLINAAMPFSQTPVRAAGAFVIPAGAENDHQRALLCLTQAIYYEAGFEPMAGRRAVAQVVLNRTRHPAFPKSVCGVVYQRNSTPVCQFSFVCDGSLDRRPEPGAWRIAQQIAAAALAGQVEASVGSATHYHADYVAPRWAPLLAKIHKIGAHIFYRWPGAWGLPGAFTGRYLGEPRDPATMRPAVLRLTGEEPGIEAAPIGTGPILDGTALKRAPNDVGGLLDTSKGWTLNIPLPGETSSAARAVAEKQSAAPAPAAAAQYGPAPTSAVIAAR